VRGEGEGEIGGEEREREGVLYLPGLVPSVQLGPGTIGVTYGSLHGPGLSGRGHFEGPGRMLKSKGDTWWLGSK
jgi:hypothetical protein